MEETPQRKWFITFGGPTENYHNAVARICSEARAINVFDHIIGYTEKYLIQDTTFWNKHKDFIFANERGYGYWIWKSYLTKKMLEDMSDNDILVYADAGCKINPNGKPRLLEYFDIVNKSKFANLSIQMDHLEKSWSKMNIIQYYDANQRHVVETGQLISGVYILRKCQHTIELIDRWYEGACNYHLSDDSPSSIPNAASFNENRHDQSLFSVIRKKLGTEMTEIDETYFEPDWNILGGRYPFWAVRMRY
jgi:hypothetical protein